MGEITPCERGQSVTDLYAFSASGFFVRSVLIYPRKRMQQEDHRPPCFLLPAGSLNILWCVLQLDTPPYFSCEDCQN